MNQKHIPCILVMAALALVPAAHGGGSGIEESDVLFINQSYLKVQLEASPAILEGDEEEISLGIATINDDTGETITGGRAQGRDL